MIKKAQRDKEKNTGARIQDSEEEELTQRRKGAKTNLKPQIRLRLSYAEISFADKRRF
jgi:hypothetical protein